MSTLFTHAVVPLAVGIGLGRQTLPWKVVAVGCGLTILPDIDVVGFFYGVSYYSVLGHRGITHSIAFALVCALLAVLAMKPWQSLSLPVFLFFAAAMISHGVLDALTHGGLGVGFAMPVDNGRYFFPERPLPVSPIGIDRFFNRWGWYVLKTEFYRVWIPMFVLTLALIASRRALKLWKKLSRPPI